MRRRRPLPSKVRIESWAETGNKRADVAASVALFGVILVVSVGLALWTDLPIVARGAIAIVGGIVAAAVVFAIVSRRTRA